MLHAHKYFQENNPVRYGAKEQQVKQGAGAQTERTFIREWNVQRVVRDFKKTAETIANPNTLQLDKSTNCSRLFTSNMRKVFETAIDR